MRKKPFEPSFSALAQEPETAPFTSDDVMQEVVATDKYGHKFRATVARFAPTSAFAGEISFFFRKYSGAWGKAGRSYPDRDSAISAAMGYVSAEAHCGRDPGILSWNIEAAK